MHRSTVRPPRWSWRHGTRRDPLSRGRHRTGNKFDVDIGSLNRIMVRDNDVVFGTVNANRWHYKMAADALARADKAWLGRLITRRVPLDRWSEALEYRHGDIKVVIDFVQ